MKNSLTAKTNGFNRVSVFGLGYVGLPMAAIMATRGIEVIIPDHPLPGERLPEPAVIVNPNQPGCEFESKAIAGVGVMFYVLLALRSELRSRGVFDVANQPKLDALLPLVALGTVAAFS